MIAIKSERPRVRAVRLCQQCCSTTAGADECSDELVRWAMRKCGMHSSAYRHMYMWVRVGACMCM